MSLPFVSRLLQRGSAIAPLSTRDAYDAWAHSYPAAAHNPLMRVEQAAIEPMLSHLHARDALDAGTGSGRCLPLLAATGARRIVGLDLSIAMLTRQTSGYPRACGDARRLPFRAATFDLVLSSLMAGDIADLSSCIGELTRVLAPDGHLIYSDFHPSWREQGWRRTFEMSDGRTADVPYYAHTMEEHLEALERAHLHVVAIREPRLADEDTRGRAARRRWGRLPVLVIVHATKLRAGSLA